MKFSEQDSEKLLRTLSTMINDQDPAPFRLEKIRWTLMAAGAQYMSLAAQKLTGNKVCGGPFKDMLLTPAAITNYRGPILLGCYEHELHPYVEAAIQKNYSCILNIGCAVGYYAVGFARRMPHARVEAFDIEEIARNLCNEMIRLNGVEDRVHVHGEFFGEDFEKYANEKSLVIMDIECAEKQLLDPEKFPALRKMDVLVELHDVYDPSISPMMKARFEATHNLEFVFNKTSVPDLDIILPKNFYLDPYEHLLLGWEGRGGQTPWGIFTAKA